MTTPSDNREAQQQEFISICRQLTLPDLDHLRRLAILLTAPVDDSLEGVRARLSVVLKAWRGLTTRRLQRLTVPRLATDPELDSLERVCWEYRSFGC